MCYFKYDDTKHTLTNYDIDLLRFHSLSLSFPKEIEFHDDRIEWRAVYKLSTSLMEGYNLRNNDLDSIPSSIMNLKGLKVLDLQNNKLSSLPDSMQSLQHLRLLNISGNNFTVLPACISGLLNLKGLNISINPFSKFPDSVCTMLQLEELNMNCCLLSVIPDAIGNMTTLTHLSIINNNNVSMLPKTIMNLRHDVFIWFEAQQLEYLPCWLVEFMPDCYRDFINSHHRETRSAGTYCHKFPTLMELAGRNVTVFVS